jgi:hypothetical protein
MRFIEARQIRIGDIVLFDKDEVSALWATVVGITQKRDKLKFRYVWAHTTLTEHETCYESARCLLIRRPRKRSRGE